MRIYLTGILLLGLWGCSSGERYYNPYDDPRAKAEYQTWVNEQGNSRERADDEFQSQNTWKQNVAQRQQTYQGYMNDVSQTNNRLNSVREEEKRIRNEFFEETVGLFGREHSQKERKGLTIREKRTLYDLRKLRQNQERYELFIDEQEDRTDRHEKERIRKLFERGQ